MRWWLLWSGLILLVIWWDGTHNSMRWRVHRPARKLEHTVRIKPIIFKNASVIWLNTLSDELDVSFVDISRHVIGDVDIDKLQIRVYNDINRTELAEVYEVDYNILQYGQWNFSFLQSDIHLSPFRQLVVFPQVNWTLGNGWCDWCFPRKGYYYNDWWIEPRPWRWVRWVVIWVIGMGLQYLNIRKKYKGRQVRFT